MFCLQKIQREFYALSQHIAFKFLSLKCPVQEGVLFKILVKIISVDTFAEKVSERLKTKFRGLRNLNLKNRNDIYSKMHNF